MITASPSLPINILNINRLKSPNDTDWQNGLKQNKTKIICNYKCYIILDLRTHISYRWGSGKNILWK